MKTYGGSLVDLSVFTRSALTGVALLALASSSVLWGQPSSREESRLDESSEDSEMIVLSPFMVSTEKDVGYQAMSTLAGSRLNTELFDTPAAISVMNKQFLDDIGAVNINDALEYSLNGGSETATDFTGNTITSNDVFGQMRGFAGIRQARNFFTTPSVALDTFNIERLDFARGPNAILFGIGGPGGLINTTPKQAHIGRKLADELRVSAGSDGEYRGEIDVNRTLVEQTLAARVNLVGHHRGDWQEFQERDLTGAALGVTYRPFKNTTLRFDGQYLDIDQVIGSPWPAMEQFLGWEAAGRPIARTPSEAPVGTSALSPGIYYTPLHTDTSLRAPVNLAGTRVSSGGATASISSDFRSAVTDPAIYPREASIGGPGFRGDYEFWNHAYFLEQRLGDFAIEIAYNHQEEHRRQHRVLTFNDSLSVDVNAFLPDGTYNPYAPVDTNGDGSADVFAYYIDARSGYSVRDLTQDDYRATLSYDLDLTPRNTWLGRYTVAGLLSRTDEENLSDGLEEQNVTPETGPFPTEPFFSNNNSIIRRTYLDYGSRDPVQRGALDPFDYPLDGAHGVTSAYVRAHGGAGTNTLERVDSMMIALQAHLLKERLIVTSGWRNDVQRAWGDSDGELDPLTNRFTRSTRNETPVRTEGNTQSVGAVLHILPWLSAFYNQAENFIPQGASADIYDRPLGPLRGEGKDTGIRVRAFDNRLTMSIARYENDALGATFRSPSNEFNNGIATIWRHILDLNSATPGVLDESDTARDVQNGARATQTTAGEGWEFELTANPTRQWRLTFNLSQSEQFSTDAGAEFFDYVEEHLPLWREHGDIVITNALRRNVGHLTGRTINQVIGAPAQSGEVFWSQGGAPYPGFTTPSVVFRYLAQMDALNDQVRRGMREWTGNFFTSYTFSDRGRWLDGLRLGAGVQYRGERVLGYYDVLHPTLPGDPIWGGAYTLVNLSLGYNLKVGRDRDVRLQLNVNNIFDRRELIVTDALDDGISDDDGDGSTFVATRYYYQEPRSWRLSATYRF